MLNSARFSSSCASKSWVDSGGDAEREANSAMRDIVLADTTRTTPLGSRTFLFLHAPTLRQRSKDHAEHSSRPSRSYFLQDSHNSLSYCRDGK